nr:hypothetical protein [Shigella sp. FC6544]
MNTFSVSRLALALAFGVTLTASSLSSGEYLPGSLQGKISSDDCLKKEQMVVSAIASTPQSLKLYRPTLSYFQDTNTSL